MRDRSYWILLHSEPIGYSGGKMETRVTLRPGQKGTKASILDRKPGTPPSMVRVRIAWEDRVLRQRVKDAGGRWVQTERLWVVPLAAAKRLGLGDRLVPVPDRLDNVPEVYHGEPHEKPIGINGRGLS